MAVNPKEVLLDNILIAMEGLTFSKDISAMIVGGAKRLESLISEGKVFAEKGTCAQNSKWKCNAAHVLMHCRDMRRKANARESTLFP